ncbi:putative component of type IV pili like system [Halapricum desulfuricans]|uniref:Putative component of type IV pili like system n=1 Tax=Halapricum desulfuricans TaxID=2841257 RepID=A0A897N3K9_9EURY|nr:putative component of type IV pili like system [Halapricum desulfuricans]
MALVLAVAALFVTPAAALSLSGPSQSAPQTTVSDSTAPGAQLAGVVAVGQTEIDGAIDGRAFSQAIAAAESNESKAAVVAERLPAMTDRLEDLRQQREALRTAHENGTLDRDTYRAKTAALASRIQQLEHRLDQSRSVASGLPERARAAAGLDVGEIDRLREQAGEMRGGDVAEIARVIAGPGVGMGIPDSPGGPPAGVPGNWSGGPGGHGGSGNPGPPGNGSPSNR